MEEDKSVEGHSESTVVGANVLSGSAQQRSSNMMSNQDFGSDNQQILKLVCETNSDTATFGQFSDKYFGLFSDWANNIQTTSIPRHTNSNWNVGLISEVHDTCRYLLPIFTS